jgi:putative flippase GtrA
MLRKMLKGKLSSVHSTLRRWIVFNSVGAMGIVVQMGTLILLTSGFRLNYLPATGLAVEAAVLHNFFWHERWTWADRISGHTGRFFHRFMLFHLTNGALSIAGNIILTRIFVEMLKLNYICANAIAISLCAILNFVASDRFVFRAFGTSSEKGVVDMTDRSNRRMVIVILPAVASLIFGVASSVAAELHPDTVKAWDTCVEATEQRIKSELSSSKGFLALDFQDPVKAVQERQAILAGKTSIRKVEAKGDGDTNAGIPDGMIHHWRGGVFIPGVTLDFVYSRIKNPNQEDTRQEDVLDSRILETAPGQLKLYLKLQRSKIVTVVYNTEHLVRYQQYGAATASSSSIATKIAQVERLGDNKERERPEGHDSGFLWRMNSYWRYQQVSGGVIVECESMTLSRSIPSFLEPLIRPLINKVARESMQRTLDSMRARMIRAYNLYAQRN